MMLGTRKCGGAGRLIKLSYSINEIVVLPLDKKSIYYKMLTVDTPWPRGRTIARHFANEKSGHCSTGVMQNYVILIPVLVGALSTSIPVVPFISALLSITEISPKQMDTIHVSKNMCLAYIIDTISAFGLFTSIRHQRLSYLPCMCTEFRSQYDFRISK